MLLVKAAATAVAQVMSVHACAANSCSSIRWQHVLQASQADIHSNGNRQGPTLLGAEAALRVVAQQLPKIVPHMLINKREGI